MPTYQTQADIDRERKAGEEYCRIRGGMFLKNKNENLYRIDLAYFPNKLSLITTGLAEVKCASVKYGEKSFSENPPGFFVSCSKWREGASFASACGLDFFLVLRLSGELYEYRYQRAHIGVFPVAWAGRTYRNINGKRVDNDEREPSIFIDWKYITRVTAEDATDPVAEYPATPPQTEEAWLKSRDTRGGRS